MQFFVNPCILICCAFNVLSLDNISKVPNKFVKFDARLKYRQTFASYCQLKNVPNHPAGTSATISLISDLLKSMGGIELFNRKIYEYLRDLNIYLES